MKYSSKLAEIQKNILDENIKVVSFDIFDTLLVRPCLAPTDIFRIVKKRLSFEGDFVVLRIMAERYARKNKVFYHEDISINDIYKEFQKLTGISDEKINTIKDIELSVEEECLRPRNSIQGLYFGAINHGKRIILTSDMYLPKMFIERVLKKNGYKNYEQLYISSEEHITKGTGKLFQKIIIQYAREGIEAKQIVHLGDNMHADVEMPKKLGMQSYYLPSVTGIFRSKKKLEPIWRYAQKTDNTFLIGVLANYLFDDPYKPFHIESISSGRPKDFGAILFGPIFIIYIKWLLENTKIDGIKKLLFVYRDGYLIERILPFFEGIYDLDICIDRIYLSRRIRYPFYSKEKNGLINAIQNFPCPENMTVKEFIKKRICIEGKNINGAWEIFSKYGYVDMDEEIGNMEKYFFFLPELESIFRENTIQSIINTEEYIQSKIDNEKIAIVDIGYRGSVSRFLYDKLGIKNKGYQLMATPKNIQDVKKEYSIKSFLEYGFGTVEKCEILHPLLEDIVSIQEGTAIAIEKKEKEYQIVKDEKIFNQKLDDIQSGILEYSQTVCDILKKDFFLLEFDKNMLFEFLLSFLISPYQMDAKILAEMNFKDSSFIVSDNNYTNPYFLWYKKRFPNITKSALESTKEQNDIISGKISKMENAVISAEDEREKTWETINRPYRCAIIICKKLHLLEFAIYAKSVIFAKQKRKRRSKKFIEKVFINPLDISLSKLQQNDDFRKRKNILIAGAMTSFDKGTCNFINKLAAELHDSQLILLSENKFLNEERTRQKIFCPFFIAPAFLAKDQYEKVENLFISKDIRKKVHDTPYLLWGKDNLLKRHVDMSEGYAYYMVFYAAKYVEKVLDIIAPEKVILWNEFYAFHHILKKICEERKIDITYMEFGSVPGTISLEKMGQMGKSFPGYRFDEFIKFPITEQEKQFSIKIIKFLKESKLNRNVQPMNNNVDLIKRKIKIGRPIILYAGVNDYESGLVPYTIETKQYHSPFIKSSLEGLKIIRKIAEKNDWNLIYKPHPIIKKMDNKSNYENSVIIASDIDINEVIDIADVVVTILSQVSYISLIRNKPVLLLGYTQLRAKQICYEAYEVSKVERELRLAIEKGFTIQQRKNFVRHIAQMVKYNLFDDLQVKPISYGQSIKMAARYIESCNNTSEWYERTCNSNE